MLSIYTLKSASDASQYYQKGDYYKEGGADTLSFWQGKGAEILGLQGPVDFSVCKGLLEGRFPDGTLMIQKQRNQYHRPGYDLTFSAPKSVSILALVANNQEVLQAYRESVQEVIAKIEQKYGSYRQKKQGVTEIEKTGNMVFAVFEHADSRAGDPNLHHHAVLMNMTQRSDGAWRSLYADEIYNDKLLNGMEHRSLLARKLLTLGYELRFGKKGTFEIEAIPQPLIDGFSKRREEIAEWLKDHQLSGGAAAKIANFQTRAPKRNTPPSERQERWLKEVTELGFTLEALKQIQKKATERGPIKLPDMDVLAQTSVENAILHLAERQSFFSIQELIKSAKLMSILPCSEGDFLKVIEGKVKDKNLIYVKEKLLTTPNNRALETQNQEAMLRSKDSVNKLMVGWIAEMVSHFKVKTDIQRRALKFILTHKDQQTLIITNSKPVLNETLKAFNVICQNQNYYLKVLTERAASIEPLKKKLNTERVMTLEGFLLACELRGEKQKPHPNLLERWNQRFRAREARDIWVIQGEVSFNQVNRLQHWSKSFGARLIFTQSSYQESPAISSLKEKGISQFQIIAPQYYQEELKVKDALLAHFNRLETKNAVQGVSDYQERLNIAAQQSLSFGSLPLLVTLTHAECLRFNEKLRMGLIEKGILSGNSFRLNSLQALGLSQAEKSQASVYQPGDIVRFTIEKPGTSIQKGSYFEVQSVNLTTGLIDFNNPYHPMTWNPAIEQNLKKVEVFRVSEREIRVGDSLVWTRTLKDGQDKTLDRIKNQSATVRSIDNHGVTIELQNGKKVLLEGTDFKQQHWDYGYAVILKNIDYSVVKDAILVLQHPKIDQKTIGQVQEFLEHLKEHKKDPILICNDIQKVKQAIESGGMGHLPIEKCQEVPYLRAEALAEHQSTVTQQIFSGLQGEYLKVRQLNPEFLPQNLENIKAEAIYSPEFRIACDMVDKLCLYHAERDAVLKLKVLKLEAAQLGGLQVSIENIEQAFDLALQQGWLVVVPKQDKEAVWVATRHTVLMEKLCIQKMKAEQNQLTPIISAGAPALNEIAEHQSLTSGQKKAIYSVLTTKDRFAAIQGIAGAGKTTALKEIDKHCDEAGFKTLVLANTGSAKNQAKQASGIAAMTTAQFLTRTEALLVTDFEKVKQEYGGNRLIILDEASLISTQEMFRLQTVVKQLDVRLRWVGDFKQIGSIGAGDAFHDLLAYGAAPVAMTENVRLNDETAFAAMKSAYAGDMAKTLHLLRDSIEEMPEKKEALNNMVEVYFLIKNTKKVQPLVITPLNEDRRFVNNAIRERLKETQALTGNALEISVLLPTDRREIDKKDILSYELSDRIRFNSEHPRLGIKANDYVNVIKIDVKHHRLHLKLDNGKTVYWAPKNLEKSSAVEIYREEKRELLLNDTIIFKRNHEAKGIFNGDKTTIVKIEDNKVDVLLTNNQVITLDFTQKENQHLDYGYALTPYAAQGRDVHYVIAYGEGPKSYPRKATELKSGDHIVLPGPDQKRDNPDTPQKAKVVEVVNIEGEHLSVRLGTELITVPNSKDRVWEYFPPFEERQEQELPLSTSQQSFIVQITRGDWLYLVVPYLQDFQKTLEKHQRIKQSALSHLDPNWQSLSQGVNRLVENISGKAESVPFLTLKEMSLQEDGSLSQSLNIDKKHLNVKPLKSSRTLRAHKTKESFMDKEVLNEMLVRNSVGFSTQWLGKPSKSTSREARWGTHGSLCVTFEGPKAGFWKNHETGEGGRDLISLYAAIHGIDWKQALWALADECGLKNSRAITQLNKPRMQERDLKLEKEYQNKRIQLAQKAYQKTIPITGTLAEKYLREYRSITGELPTSFRFSPGIKHFETQKITPALVAPIHDKSHTLTGIVRIFLNEDGSKLKETFIDQRGEVKKATDKANLGISAKGAVLVQKGELSRTLWVAEGVETALSVAKAVPDHTVVASLSVSQLKNVPVDNEIQKVVICADHDPPSFHIKKNIIEAVEHYLLIGKKVFIAMPSEIPLGMKKCDFNDLMKQGGLDRVKDVLKTQVELKSAELLKSQETSLSSDLEKIRGVERTEVTPKPLVVPSKVPMELER